MRVGAWEEEIDSIVAAVPEGVFRPTDELLLVGEFEDLSRDPLTPLMDLRERTSSVVERDADGTFDGLRLPNLYMQEEGPARFVVLGYDAHSEMMRNWEVFRAGDGAFGAAELILGSDLLVFLDGPEHARQRSLMLQAFGRAAVRDLSERLIQPTAEVFIERFVRILGTQGEADVCRDLALPYVFRVMANLFGLSDEDFGRFVSYGTAIFSPFSDFQAAARALTLLNELFLGEIERRRTVPSSDLISWLMEAEVEGTRLTDEEIVLLARFFLPAGIETTWRGIGLMTLALMDNEKCYQEVCSDQSLAAAAVEESLRWAAPAFSVPRRARLDAHLDGVEVPAGALVMSYPAVVNRDPRRWTDPNTFSLHRSSQVHVAFNSGPHMCIGMHLARLEMQAVLQGLARRLPSLRLAVPRAQVEILGLTLRTPVRVPVAASITSSQPTSF